MFQQLAQREGQVRVCVIGRRHVGRQVDQLALRSRLLEAEQAGLTREQMKNLDVAWVVAFLWLGYLGTQSPTPAGTLVSQVLTLVYFGFFALMPWWSRMGTFKPVPDRITFTAH